jgi:opacity protein-like surface antigen
MKVIIGMILTAVLTATAVQAQHVNMGIKGGLNLYSIYNADNSGTELKPGWHLGLLWHIHKGEHLALQPEVVYSVQGANLAAGAKLNLGYINVPILFQYMFNNGFRLEAGPQFGVLLHAESELSGNSDNVKNNFKPMDIALAGGIGYVSPSGFGVDARYNYGLNNINDLTSDKITNAGFQLGVFYLFHHQ